MVGLILGFALGAMAFTETGRSLGNQAAKMAETEIKKILETKQETKKEVE